MFKEIPPTANLLTVLPFAMNYGCGFSRLWKGIKQSEKSSLKRKPVETRQRLLLYWVGSCETMEFITSAYQ